MGLIESIRKWIDGETGEDLLEAADEHAKPRRVWEEFLVKIAREVEAAMQREMFTPPGGPTYIPREYIVYLSAEDDKDWQGDKRRGLEQGLFHVLSERARELSGSTQLAVKSFAVELRVDSTPTKRFVNSLVTRAKTSRRLLGQRHLRFIQSRSGVMASAKQSFP